jgi:hypothetical protein
MSSADSRPAHSPAEPRSSLLLSTGGRYLIRTWVRLVVFFLPIVIFIAPVVYYVDPFGLFAKSSGISEAIRSQYAQRVNQVFWKMPAYARHPLPNLLLGDSQTARLPVQILEQDTGEQYSNLAYGGGTLQESVSTFWFASRRVPLQKVFFGISFMQYNPYPQDRVKQVEEILRDPLLYFMNSDVLETTGYDVADAVLHHHVDLAPQMSKDAFWVSQLQYLTTRYKRKASPQNLTKKIGEIVEYCHRHNASIVFLIPPQHVDAQRRIRELGVEADYRAFKGDLKSMAPVYDCDIDSSLTRDRSNYIDPFHLTYEAAARFAGDVASEHPVWCQILTPDRAAQ